MKEIKGLCGTHIAQACERLAREAPAFMVFNGVRIESQVGDSPGDLHARWEVGMDLAREEYEKKQRAFDATPEGQAKIAERVRARAEEKRLHEETVAVVEASGVRAKYPWSEAMGEISGFGGGYEGACRDMVYAGLAWLDAHTDEAPDEKALDKLLFLACPDCSGAMHGATMSAVFFVAKQGWPEYVRVMTERTRARGLNE